MNSSVDKAILNYLTSFPVKLRKDITLNGEDAYCWLGSTFYKGTLFMVSVQNTIKENGIWQFDTYEPHIAVQVFKLVKENVTSIELEEMGFKFF